MRTWSQATGKEKENFTLEFYSKEPWGLLEMREYTSPNPFGCPWLMGNDPDMITVDEYLALVGPLVEIFLEHLNGERVVMPSELHEACIETGAFSDVDNKRGPFRILSVVK